jgi:hypothetical protein
MIQMEKTDIVCHGNRHWMKSERPRLSRDIVAWKEDPRKVTRGKSVKKA